MRESMEKKIKITFVLPEQLQHELRQKVVGDGYGMRGKSKWVGEAIESLIEHTDFISLGYLSNEMKGFEKMETISIGKNIKNKIDNAILETRKKYPMLEGVQSRLIRTSIMQRILRNISK